MLTPFAGRLPLGRAGALNVQGIEARVGEPGNPVVPAGALQLSGQGIL